ncbi:MAG: serine dehydratase beta chain, partial [Clostridium sp.]
MKSVGIFDILGPIMIGPSSSHTAGAARLGRVARSIAGDDVVEVKFLLHGSFGKTYKGHGTDR